MMILSRVCVDFRDRHGKIIFRVPPSDLLLLREAPDEIRSDPIFDLLVSEGSMEVVVSADRRKALENDPIQNTDASGKRIVSEDIPDSADSGKFTVPVFLPVSEAPASVDAPASPTPEETPAKKKPGRKTKDKTDSVSSAASDSTTAADASIPADKDASAAPDDSIHMDKEVLKA